MGPLPLAVTLAVLNAQSVIAPVTDIRPGSLEELARDLQNTDASRRRFAIREINRVARVSRKHEFGPLTNDTTMDALQKLDFLDDHVVRICIRHLQADIEVRGCGKLVGHLETVAARPVVAAARARTSQRGEQRVLDRTLEILDAAIAEQAASPPGTESP